jgi:hypothetical protein
MNLWAEFDDNPDSPLHTLRQPHARRLTENAVQTAVRDWLLQDYAASYCRSLAATRIFRRCYWVDALDTRPTMYTNTVIPTPASLINDSPAVRSTKGRSKKATQHIPFMLQPIHELSQALAQESRPITLHGLILEAGSGKRASTKAGQKDQHVPGKDPVIPKEGGLVHAGWLETAPAILQTIDQSAAIFLLQPFGKTIFSHQDLAPLYIRTAPTELCLLISHKQVEVHLLPSLRTPAGASAFTTLLRTDRWKALLTGDQDIEHIINALIKALIASMQQHFLAVQPIAFPMQIGPAVVELAPATLVFATRRQDSLACMNDAVCLYRRRLDQQSHRGVLMEDWFAMQQQQRLDDQFQLLYDRIVQAGQTQRTRRWPELRQRLLLASFGQHTVNDYDQVMNKLINSGKVRCEWRQVSPLNSGMEEPRIPGNEDTLLWV